MPQTFVRDRFTWQMYLMLGFYGYLLNLFGPMTPYLQSDLHLSYAQASFHYTAFAFGMILAGIIGTRLTIRLGVLKSIWFGGFGMSLGALLFFAGKAPAVTIGASFWMGLAGSQILSLVPGLLSTRHGARGAVALTEANVIAGLISITGPLVVRGLAVSSLGWRAALILPVIFLAGLYLIFGRGGPEGSFQPARETEKENKLPWKYWVYWAQIVCGVAVEFCMIFWGATYLQNVTGLPRAAAASATSLFMGGMIAGRMAGSRLLHSQPPGRVLLGALSICALGFGIFWSAGSALLSLAGFALAGLGTANFYPVSITMAIQAAGTAVNKASTRATLASGTAIIALPLLLGGLADAVGLRLAFLVVPVLLAITLGILFLSSRLKRPGSQIAERETICEN